MSERTLEELLAVVARSLGALAARVVEADVEAPSSPSVLSCDLADGKRLVVELAAPPADAAALHRRLEMLADTFADLLPRDKPRRSSRPAPVRTLSEELSALALRAGAIDAVIIDAHSPVVWGSAAHARDAEGNVEGPAEEEKPTPTSDAPPQPTQLRLAPLPSPLGPRAVPSPSPSPVPLPLRSVGAEDVEAVHFGLASAQGVRVDPGAMTIVPRAVCARHRVLPIARDGDKLVLAMADPMAADAIHDVVLTTGLDVEAVFAGDSMAAFFQHLDEGGDAPSYDEVMASIDATTRAAREPRARRARAEWARTMGVRRAIADVRALPEMATLHKGGHLREMVQRPDHGFVARSFAAIYVLVVVFEGPFEELLAKRAVAHVLPTIERLVAALPPLDPTPVAGAAAMRRRPRRR